MHDSDHAISRNPATDGEIARYPFASPAAIETILVEANTAFAAWRETGPENRAACLHRLADLLRDECHAIAETITREMGKTLAESRAEVEKCADHASWYAQNGPAWLADEPAPVPNQAARVSFLPTGVILGIMPWNFPLWQALRAAVPILLGGNGFLLKPAPNVVGSALAMCELGRRAGLPHGLFAVLNCANAPIEAIVHDRRIAGVTLTGSPRAGAAVAAMAGAALKPSVLELGGSDPFVVLADADLDAAVQAGIAGRYGNCGQVCIAAKRFLIEAPVADAFLDRFVAAARALRVGDPLDPAVRMGPMARPDLRDELHGQVGRTLSEGASLVLGGHAIEGPGNFYAPTVLTGVTPGMTAFEAETFGPVAAFTVARDAAEAIALANTSDYGLSASLWTADRDRARVLARRIETGGVFINGVSASDPRVPIGGVKRSGYGRELSHFGLRAFLNAQTVWDRTAS
jgi:succinate-semialdehyde dehydrogenase